jgi:predicted ATP-grasp superfamily ATP-dependent carboligase
MPGGETGMVALSMYRGGMPSDAKLAVCHSDTVARATDKAALARLAESGGLRVPPTFAISAQEAERGLPVELPAVVKPRRSQIIEGDGFRGFGVTMAQTRGDVARALRALPGERGLIQHYHTGTLCGVGGVFWDGEVVTAVHQRAVRTWPRGCGEMSFAVARPRDAELERRISRMLLDLGWAGLFQVQFLDTDDGPLPIDLNPRVYGSLALALGVGPNLPGVWADVVTGRAVENRVAYDARVRFRNEVLDSRALIAACLSGRHGGKLGDAGTERAGHRRTVNAYYERSDPRPLLALPWIVGTRLRTRAIHRH